MSQKEMRKVKQGLVEVFETEINPLLKEFQSTSEDDWEEWQTFE
jgi:hypothetical protein